MNERRLVQFTFGIKKLTNLFFSGTYLHETSHPCQEPVAQDEPKVLPKGSVPLMLPTSIEHSTD